MTRQRIILLDDDGLAVTGIFSDGQLTEVGEGLPQSTLPLGAAPHDEFQTWVIVPGQQVVLHSVELPPGSESKATEALAFLLEDEVAVSLDEVHFVLGPAHGDKRSAAAVSRAVMTGWLAHLAQHGIDADALVPEYLSIPDELDCACIIYRGQSAIVSFLGGHGFTVEGSMIDIVLPLFFVDAGIQQVNVHGSMTQVGMIQRVIPQIDVRAYPPLTNRDLLGMAYLKLSSGVDFNLRQGSFAKRRRWSPALQPWRRAAALALILVGLAITQQAIAAWRLMSEVDEAFAKAERIARETLPPSTRVVNARAQMKGQVNALRAGSSEEFLLLSNTLGESLTSVGVGSLEALRFDRNSRALGATVAVSNYDALAKLKSALVARGVAIDEGEARQTGDALLCDITLRLP